MLPGDAERIAFNTRLLNDALWARFHERKEKRRAKRQMIAGALALAVAAVVALQGPGFGPVYELIGRAGIAGAVLIYGAPYLEWLLFPKDRPVKKVQWDPEKAYAAPEPAPQQAQAQPPRYQYAPFIVLTIAAPFGLLAIGLLVDLLPQRRPLLVSVALVIVAYAWIIKVEREARRRNG